MGLATRTIFSTLILTMALGAKEQEKKLTRKELPAAVLSAFQKTYPKAHIKGIAEEKKDGKTYFEIESLDGKTERDLLYLADGSVAEIEESMAVADLPEAVKASLEANYPKAKLLEVEKVTKGSEVSYGLDLRSAKGRVTIDMDASGRILKEESPEGKKK